MRPLDEASVRAAESAFKAYYFERLASMHTPPMPGRREFGYQRFNSGMVRHLRARDDKELRLLAMRSTPSDMYCSNGYYSFPDLPMSEKDWRGADLIFDIDAKDLALPCRPSHTMLVCQDCGRARTAHDDGGGRGGGGQGAEGRAAGAAPAPAAPPAPCPACGSTRHEAVSLPCTACIDGAKRQVALLLRLLAEDLGVKRESTRTYFSGNEGFHVYAYGTPYEALGAKERGEIADYILFKGARADSYGFRRGSAPGKADLPEHGDDGWRGRLAGHLFRAKGGMAKGNTRCDRRRARLVPGQARRGLARDRGAHRPGSHGRRAPHIQASRIAQRQVWPGKSRVLRHRLVPPICGRMSYRRRADHHSRHGRSGSRRTTDPPPQPQVRTIRAGRRGDRSQICCRIHDLQAARAGRSCFLAPSHAAAIAHNRSRRRNNGDPSWMTGGRWRWGRGGGMGREWEMYGEGYGCRSTAWLSM